MNTKKLCDMACGVSTDSKSLDLALLLIRISVAATFIVHGWQKVSGIENFIPFFATLGFGTLLTYFVAYAEFLGGIAILLGIFTRLVGGVFAAIMLVAIYAVHLKNGFNNSGGGYEFQLLLLVTSIAIALVGPGRYSLHHKWCGKK